MNATAIVAQWVSGSRAGDLPADVRHETLRALVNWIGSPVAASGHDTVERAHAALAPFFGPAQATLLGRGARVDAPHAALLNGIASGIYDFDDTHLASVVHPTAAVASAVLALAEWRPASGAQVVHALAVGIELACRLGCMLAVAPAQGVHGWFSTATTGVVAAAAACANLLGLDPDRATHALGIAAARASGTRLNHGSMTKNLSPACAAVDGLSAALLAERGFTADRRAIEGPNGFAALYCVAPHLPALVDGLGARFELRSNTYKPYPSGIVTHAPIDAAQRLRRRTGLRAADVDHVQLSVHPLCLTLCGNRHPGSATEATFSVHHWVALGLSHDTLGIRHFDDALVADPDIRALRDRIHPVVVEGSAKDEAAIRVTTRAGAVLEEHVDHAIGGIERPMSDAELGAKLADLCGRVLGDRGGRNLLDACWALPQAGGVDQLIRAAMPLT